MLSCDYLFKTIDIPPTKKQPRTSKQRTSNLVKYFFHFKSKSELYKTSKIYQTQNKLFSIKQGYKNYEQASFQYDPSKFKIYFHIYLLLLFRPWT